MTLRRLWILVLALAAAVSFAERPATSSNDAQRKTSHDAARPKDFKTEDATTIKVVDRSTATAHAASSAKPIRPVARASRLRCKNCDRDQNGKILRSRDARKAFKKGTGFPDGRPGFVIDHIIPIACGGADVPSNMQWQTKEAAKAKDKRERAGCRT
jgi:hypothetical protein